ncbi:MAG: hypothetical protein IPI67_36400 [Myxococcales bacterium]|nr:hypothetical protein [Myxococcales bacterium]
MTHRSHPLFAAISLVICLGTAGCGAGSDGVGGGGNAGAAGGNGADGTSCPTKTGPAAADDYSSMLLGKFSGNRDSFIYAWELRADHTALVGDHTSDDPAPTTDLCSWSVSGADEMPDYDSRWLIRFSPSDDTMKPETHQIVVVATDGFTLYRKIEGHDVFTEMQRVK